MKPYHVIVEPGFWDKLAAFGTFAAAAAVLVTLLLGWVGLRRDRANSTANAERAENAARLAIRNTEQLVDALQAIARAAASARGTVAPAPPKVTWAMTFDRGSLYRLTNTGDAVAHDVRLTADETLALRVMTESREIQPGGALIFMAALTMGTRDLTITVTWSDDDGLEHDWRYPLPPKS